MISVILHLGYGFLRASLTAPFRRGKGAERFLESYGPEGLVPFSVLARELSAEFERCLDCGLCELSTSTGATPRDLAAAWWRSPVCWECFREITDGLDVESLRDAEASCPAEIPLTQLVAEMRAQKPDDDGAR